MTISLHCWLLSTYLVSSVQTAGFVRLQPLTAGDVSLQLLAAVLASLQPLTAVLASLQPLTAAGLVSLQPLTVGLVSLQPLSVGWVSLQTPTVKKTIVVNTRKLVKLKFSCQCIILHALIVKIILGIGRAFQGT